VLIGIQRTMLLNLMRRWILRLKSFEDLEEAIA
jgi:hypothetical protein